MQVCQKRKLDYLHKAGMFSIIDVYDILFSWLQKQKEFLDLAQKFTQLFFF